MFAGEIIPPGLFKRIKDKGGIPFNVYSTSELLTPLSYNVDEKDIKILPNIEYKIIDNELFCKKKNAEWYSTGDAVEQKDDAIYILGLKKSEILHNGSKIYPEIYESIVRSNPKIVDVLLRKKTDKLILYYYGNVSEDTVQEMLKERFTDSNMPEIIKKLDYVIPRTLYGQPIRSNEFIFGFES
jgi:acyl-CoA synthetase (AMP-forming)/AMP-acid ligase II